MSMKKSILVSGLVALAVITSSLNATDKFDLKANMMKLNVELVEIQRGLMSGSQKKVEVTLDSFEIDVSDLLGDNGKDMKNISKEMKNKAYRAKMMRLLPEDMKNKKHKVSVAMESARKIKVGMRNLREALKNNEELSIRKRQIKTQESYLNIVNACFMCHNLVRDKKKIK